MSRADVVRAVLALVAGTAVSYAYLFFAVMFTLRGTGECAPFSVTDDVIQLGPPVVASVVTFWVAAQSRRSGRPGVASFGLGLLAVPVLVAVTDGFSRC